MSQSSPDSGTVALRDVTYMAMLVAWVVLSRLPHVPDFVSAWKDGPLYVQALQLDGTFSVPAPGNLGFVLLGRIAQLLFPNPIDAYAAVNIALQAAGACFTYLLGRLVLPRGVAAAAALALSCNAMVWWHGTPISSYNGWLASIPATAWLGGRFLRARRAADIVMAAAVVGLGTLVRSDVVVFAGPLWLAFALLGRASWKWILLGGALIALPATAGLLGTVHLVGMETFREQMALKAEACRKYSFSRRGWVEGVGRNGSKYVLWLLWSAHWLVLPFLLGVIAHARRLRDFWRRIVVGISWNASHWWVAFVVFAATPAIVLVLLPMLYLVAAWWLAGGEGAPAPRRAAIALAITALLGIAQFELVPLLEERNQRDVIVNVTILRYTAAGVRQRYNYNLDDFRLDPSLRSVVRQLRHPEPIPHVPSAPR